VSNGERASRKSASWSNSSSESGVACRKGWGGTRSLRPGLDRAANGIEQVAPAAQFSVQALLAAPTRPAVRSPNCEPTGL
jgi:hypothetical protein